jgi:putative glutamine amidotransferase
MPKPCIGLTTTRTTNQEGRPTFAVNQPYVRSISDAGGLPVLIPLDLSQDDLDTLLHRLDGILFTGGYDIDPQRYGNPPHPKVKGVDLERDREEMHLVQAAVKSGKPFFGICRGLQVINVALGGSLYEDLADQSPGAIWHDNHDKPRNYLAHDVKVEIDSRLLQILDERQTMVNSLHHQGVCRLSNYLRPTAFASDDLIEAIELPGDRFGLAVQWHPEELQAHGTMRSLFQAFIHACNEYN